MLESCYSALELGESAVGLARPRMPLFFETRRVACLSTFYDETTLQIVLQMAVETVEAAWALSPLGLLASAKNGVPVPNRRASAKSSGRNSESRYSAIATHTCLPWANLRRIPVWLQ